MYAEISLGGRSSVAQNLLMSLLSFCAGFSQHLVRHKIRALKVSTIALAQHVRCRKIVFT